MTKESMEEPTFTIIASAGECRALTFEAVELAEEGKIEEAKTRLKEAEQAFYEAHKVQTAFINAEAKGEEIPFSILFMHAEDHLMNASSEVEIAKRLISLAAKFSLLEERVSKLEEKKENS
jgi:PTS system cellobiose-specific IIA component